MELVPQFMFMPNMPDMGMFVGMEIRRPPLPARLGKRTEPCLGMVCLATAGNLLPPSDR